MKRMLERKWNEEIYEKKKDKKEEYSLHNAKLCEKIADESFLFNYNEAIYWSKKGIEIREEIYGNKSIKNTKYYEKLVEFLVEKGSYKEAIKWNKKSYNVKKKANLSELQIIDNIIMFSRIYFYERLNNKTNNEDEILKYADMAYEIMEKYSKLLGEKRRLKIYLRLIQCYGDYNFLVPEEKRKFRRFNFCFNEASRLTQSLYTENSIEMAKIYQYQIDYKESLENGDRTGIEEERNILGKIFLIYLEKEGMNSEKARWIFGRIWHSWKGEEAIIEGAKWVYENLSSQYIRNIMEDFACDIREKIEEQMKLWNNK